jgi:hypothetical protein
MPMNVVLFARRIDASRVLMAMAAGGWVELVSQVPAHKRNASSAAALACGFPPIARADLTEALFSSHLEASVGARLKVRRRIRRRSPGRHRRATLPQCAESACSVA